MVGQASSQKARVWTDDYVFISTGDGSIVRKGREMRNWFALSFFALVLLVTFLGLLWSIVTGAYVKPVTAKMVFEVVIGIGVWTFVCTLPILHILGLKRKPAIRFDAQARRVRVGRGDDQETDIPFADVARVVAVYTRARSIKHRYTAGGEERGVCSISLQLAENVILSQVARVTGPRGQIQKRARELVELIASVTQAPVEYIGYGEEQ